MGAPSPYPCCGGNNASVFPPRAPRYGPEIIADGPLTGGQTTLAYTLGDHWVSDGDPNGTIKIIGNALEFEKTSTAGTSRMNVNNLYTGWSGVAGFENTPLVPLGPNDYKIEFDIEQNDEPDSMRVGIALGDNGQTVYPTLSSVGHYVLTMTGADPNSFTPARQFFTVICDCTKPSLGVVRATNFSVKRMLYS